MKGIRAGSAEWIAFLDGDDVWNADHLQELDAIRQQFPDAALIGCGYKRFSGEIAPQQHSGGSGEHRPEEVFNVLRGQPDEVAVEQENELRARGAQPGGDRSALAQILEQLDDPGSVLPGRPSGRIAGTVADHDHIVYQRAPSHGADDVADRPFFVERRNDRCDSIHIPPSAAV